MVKQEGQAIMASGHFVNFLTQETRSDLLKKFDDAIANSNTFIHIIGLTDTGGTVDIYFRMGEIASIIFRDQPAITRVK